MRKLGNLTPRISEAVLRTQNVQGSIAYQPLDCKITLWSEQYLCALHPLVCSKIPVHDTIHFMFGGK